MKFKRSRWMGPKTRKTAAEHHVIVPLRYSDEQDKSLSKYIEQWGWSKGARVKRGKASA